MSPDTVLSGVGQAWNIASGIGGMIQSKRNLKRQLSWQSEENQKARDYNERMVKYQNEENLKQWQRENEYNTLSNQKKRAIAAGMNPDLLYGSGASGGNLAGSSPQLNAPSYGEPMDFSAVGSQRVMSDFVNQAANTAQMIANVKKTNADTEKTKEETEGQKETNRILSSDADFREALNANDLELGNVSITNATRCRNTCKRVCNSHVKHLRILQIELLKFTSISRANTSILTRRQKKHGILASRLNKLFTHILHNITYRTFLTRYTITKTKTFGNRGTFFIILIMRTMSPTLLNKL